MTYKLDTRLENLSHLVALIGDIEVRLADDSRYLWLYLVPQIAGVTELEDLDKQIQDQLFGLATYLSASLKVYSQADKMNVAAIGNIVSQFHFHIVARHVGDEAWPDPIWGRGTMQPYDNKALSQTLSDLRAIIEERA